MRYSKKIRTEIYKILATTNCNVTKLCKLIDIDRSTYYKWHNDYREFRNLVKKSRAEFRSEKRENIISSLYKRAMGYMVTEIRETIKLNAEGEQIEKKIVTHKKYVRPSEKAIKYFLDNFNEEGFEINGAPIEEEISDDDDDTEENDIDDDDEEDSEDIETYPLSLQDTHVCVPVGDVQGTCFQHTHVCVPVGDVQGVRQAQIESINLQIESESENIIESEIKIEKYVKPEFNLIEHIINPEVPPEDEIKLRAMHRDYQESLDQHAKLREAVALVISEASPKRQKEVEEAIKNSGVEYADYLIGIPHHQAMHIAKRIYEEKRNEYRKKRKLPDEYFPLKPYPIAFNTDAGTRRMNESYRERMHDIPIIEEAKALKKYIIAARMERYYEGNIIHSVYRRNA